MVKMLRSILLFILLFINSQYLYSAQVFPVNDTCPLSDRTPNLKASWHMDADVDPIIDSSGNGYTGAASGNPVNGAAYFSNGEILDGTGDYFTVTDAAGLSAISPLTIMLWQKSTATTNSYCCWINKYAAGQREWVFDYRPADGYVAFWVYDESISKVVGDYWGPDTGIRDGSWHFMVAVWDGGTSVEDTKVYKDGVLMQDLHWHGAAGFVAIENGSADIKVGRGTETATFTGTLDDVAIINRALTLNEIGAIYRQQIQRHR